MTATAAAADEDPAVSVCFVVEIDDFSLGSFNSCEGLGCEVVMEQHEEGGNNGYVWQLPSRIKFSSIKLSRPVTKDTEKVTRWIASMVSGVTRKTGHISAMTMDGTVVARWSLLDVVPVRWQGPSLSPDTLKVATETLEIAHHGFLSAG